jgi:4-hydroxy-3-polyprenylbenzoate decarboxylase
MGMRVFVGVTGGSGARFAQRTLAGLSAAGCDIGLAVSGHGVEVIAHELFDLPPHLAELDADDVVGRFVAGGRGEGPITVYGLDDYRAPHASGSGLADAAIVVPCSMATVGAIAAGVMLKERRRLVICPRETPLSEIHLENLLRLTRAGAIVAPLAPGWYAKPRDLEDLADFMAGKLLTVLGLPHDLLAVWGEPAPDR